MKKILLYLIFFSLQSGFVFAQTQKESEPKSETKPEYQAKPLVIEDITKAMSKGTQPGFKIDVYDATKKGVEAALTKAMKEENKAKVQVLNNEHFIVGVIIKEISAKPLNIYMVLHEYDDHVEMLTFYEIDSVFLTKEKNESTYLAARKFTRNFAVKAYRGAVQERINAENDKLKNLQSELDKIHKDRDNLEKKISDGKQSIDNTKEKISTSELDQERVRKQVQDQKAVVATAKSGGDEILIKDQEKKLKGFEGDLSKLQKQEDGYHKDITNSEAAIRDSERDIAENENATIMKQADLDKQKEVINNLTKMLESIK